MRVRVLYDNGKTSPSSVEYDGLSKEQALEQFSYFIRCALELNMQNIRCVILFSGNRWVKHFQNRC